MDVVNPFVYSRPVGAADVIGRDIEIEQLLALAAGGHYATVSAPRRFGKTSLLQRVAEEARAGSSKMHAVRVDFDTVTSVEEAVRRIAAAYHDQLETRARRVLTETVRLIAPSVRMGAPGAGVSLSIAAGQERDALASLLELPRRLSDKSHQRTLVIFDEFQDLLAVGDGLDGLVRSHIQHQGESASYIFAGSQTSLMRELFADRERPLYGQAHIMHLGPLAPGPLGEFILARFEQTDRDPGEPLEALLRLAGGHPQRSMLLAHHLWAATPPGSIAGASQWEAARTLTFEQLREAYRAEWGKLPATQRAVLTIAAHGGSPYGKAELARYGVTRSGAQNARARLTELGDLLDHDGAFVDPLFAEWLTDPQVRAPEPAPSNRDMARRR